MSSTIRKLSNSDVRVIFESLHDRDQLPPPHLKFQIIPVGPNGLKLSPPSYEFEDGLYILLKPDKKRKNVSKWVPDYSKIPSHLKNMAATKFPPATCPWSLSGPQFPQPTAIQQRYCYPKGDAGYSGKKGAALWTMFDRCGKEDLEFRLLHVYFSAKRASNRGVSVPVQEQRKSRRTTPTSTPRRRRSRTPSNQSLYSLRSNHSMCSTPRSLHSTVTESPSSNNNINSDSFMQSTFPPMPLANNAPGLQRQLDSIFVSPNTSISNYPDNPFLGHPFHPLPSFELERYDQNSHLLDQNEYPFVEEHFRNDECNCCDQACKEKEDRAQLLMDADSLLDIDSYWNDPLFATTMRPDIDQEDSACEALKDRLQFLQRRINDLIVASPNKNPMVDIVVSWADGLAKAPLMVTSGSHQKLAPTRETEKLKMPSVPEETEIGPTNETGTTTWTVTEDALIFHLKGLVWSSMSKHFPNKTEVTVKKRHDFLKQRFEKCIVSVNSTSALSRQIQTLQQSPLLKATDADVYILKHLADFIMNGKKLMLDGYYKFGPFYLANKEVCKRCGMLMPSFETGRLVCEKTGWCESCTCLSVCVSGDYLRYVHVLRKHAIISASDNGDPLPTLHELKLEQTFAAV